MIFFATIGFLLATWFVVGVVAFTYCRVYISPGTPLLVRLTAVVQAGIVLPWIMLTHGIGPSSIMNTITPAHLSDEERQRIDAWRKANCQCDKCRERRGE